MIVTKAPEPSFAFPNDHPIEGLPEPVVELTTEQKLALAEAEKRDQERQREWASIAQALEDDSMAVFRAMRRFRSESAPEQVERVLTSFEDGRFLIDRMGAECAVDQDLAVVLLDLRRSSSRMPTRSIASRRFRPSIKSSSPASHCFKTGTWALI